MCAKMVNISRSKGMTREQKWSVFMLSIGTFLEYFDLMLYVHMATLLNDLLFPQANPATAQLLGATAFCTTYLLRPIGGLFIGWIGDKWGRKFTITLTTFLMSAACLIMVFTPEYKEWGISATIMIIVARMLQGFSSLGEKVGAFLYMSEILKVPYKCVAAGIMGLSTGIGGIFALITASIVLSTDTISWRWAFIVGAFVAVIGVFSRLRLRETPEFLDYKLRIANKMIKNHQNPKIIRNANIGNEKVNKKTIFAFAFTELHISICMYVGYVHLADFMKKSLGMNAGQIATHNLKVTIFTVMGLLMMVTFLVKKFHPVKVAIITALIFIIALPFMPYWLGNVSGLFSLFCLQSLIFLFSCSTQGTLDAIQYKYFPIKNRFTYMATIYGIVNPLSKVLTAFSLIPLTHYLGYYALWIVFTPAVIGYLWALYYFRKLEIERGLYYDYPCEPKPVYEDTASDKSAYSYALSPDYDAFKGECEHSKNFLDKMRELNKEATIKVNIKLVEKAIVFAKRWHGTQVRKTGEPFYHHPIAVADIISNYYFKTDVLVACVLHDVVEDDKTKQCTFELIEKEFNKRIAQLVEGVTKNKVVNGKDKIFALKETLDDLSEKKEYEALLIKITDRTHNMQTADGWSPEKRRKKAIETTRDMLPLVAPVADKLGIEEGIEMEEKLFKPTNKALNKDE